MKDGCDHIVFVDNNKIPHTGDNESLYRCGYTFFPPVEVLLKCRGSAAEVPLKCHWSSIEMQTATATDFPLLTPPLSTIGWSKTARFNNQGNKYGPPLFLKIVSSQAKKRNTFVDPRSPRHPKVGVSKHHGHTYIHTDIATLRLNRSSGPIHWKSNHSYKKKSYKRI